MIPRDTFPSQRMMGVALTSLLALVVGAALFQSPSPAFGAVPDQDVVSVTAPVGSPSNSEAVAQQTLPQTILSGQGVIEHWQMAGGFLYWYETCQTFLGETRAILERRPIEGAIIATLFSVDDQAQCETLLGAAVDESGFYYYNRSSGYIEAIYADSPAAPPARLVLVGERAPIGFGSSAISGLRVDSDFVYWIEVTAHGEFEPDDIVLKRVAKVGGAAETLHSYEGALVGGLGLTGNYVWWTDSEGLHRIGKPGCAGVLCDAALVREHFLRSGRIHVVNESSGIYWWDANPLADQNPEILRTSCRLLRGCSTTSLYTAPDLTSIRALAANTEHVYWTEFVTHVGFRLRRLPVTSGTAETIYEEDDLDVSGLALDEQWLYFRSWDREKLLRLPLDAEAITRQIRFAGWEVTQGIQSLDNDVPLVAGKLTFVRVYGALDDGNIAAGVEALLHGSRGGSPLPGSPLLAVNGTTPVSSTTPLDHRADLDGGWLFRLPDSWTQAEDVAIPLNDADLTLRVVLDPRGISGDTTPANNVGEETFTFTAKAPVCMTLRPVETEGFYQSPSDISVGLTLDLAESILPTPRLLDYPKWDLLSEIDWCWKGIVYGPFCSTPYELDEDDSGLLTKMGLIDYFADNPDICFTHNARTLFSGIVHNDAPWEWGGLARTGKDQHLTKVPKYGAWSRTIDRFTPQGMTMVHEMGHNFDRGHVDCGGPDDPDTNYPYDPATLDDGPLNAPSTHFGFDTANLEPIRPDMSRDYMSYCGPKWVSDYTWTAIFNKIRDPIFDFPFPLTLALTDTGTIAIAAGILTPTTPAGELRPLWTFPASEASPSLLAKWAEGQAAPWGEASETPYHLQLLGAGGAVLGDWAVEVVHLSVHGHDEPVPFLLTFPAPDQPVEQVRLMEGATVLAAVSPGNAPPTVAIGLPAGGESVEREVTLMWVAADPDGADELVYTIQYSPDLGAHWYALAADFPGSTGTHTVRLDLSGQPGSDGAQALLRVLASDGYNTGRAVSEPFTVAPRAPVPAITAPLNDAWFGAGEPVPLRGRVFDAEESLVDDESLVWSVGATSATGRVAEASGLAPGPYTVALSATDRTGLQGAAQVTFNVAPLEIPTAASSALALDGACDDPAYVTAPALPLAPYPDGSRATAFLARTAGALRICLQGLQNVGGYAGLYVDVDNSRDATAQTGDAGFFVQLDGTPHAVAGGDGAFEDVRVDGWAARIHQNGAVWNAELQLNAALLGGWNHRVGLTVGHFESGGGAGYMWPVTAGSAPASWAQTNLGDPLSLVAVSPLSTTLGSGPLALTVTGSGFDAETVVLWNEIAISPTTATSTTVEVIVPVDLLGEAGVYDVRVAPATASALASPPQRVTVYNPVPEITSVGPQSITAGAPGFTMVVEGTGFVEGAVVLWDGEARPTTFVNGTRLQAMIRDGDLQTARDVRVTVLNPEPNLGASNARLLTVELRNAKAYLPLIRKR